VYYDYFTISILKLITCHEGKFAGFFITKASEVCFHLSFSVLPTIETEAIAFKAGLMVFERDLIFISSSGLPRQNA
jgi:hypothetical protein